MAPPAGPDPLEAARLLARAAVAAWATVKDDPKRHDKVGRGAGGNLTSKADDVLEKAILREAKRLRLNTLSEEVGLVTYGKGPLLAVVDPLDGSRNAGRGIPFHCTSVAVGPAAEGLAGLQAGVVINLVTGDAYEAARGKGVRVNGKPPKRSAFDPDEVLVGIIADYSDSEIAEAQAKPEHHIRDLGSAALEMCLVGTGAMDAFIVRKPWLRVVDIAAATLFVREAGGSVTDPITGTDLNVPFDLAVRAGVLAARGPAARQAVTTTSKKTTSTSAGRMRGPLAPRAGSSLTWALVGKASIPHVRKQALWLRSELRKRKQRVLLETSLAEASRTRGSSLAELDKVADLFVTVGGDGTLLLTQGATDKPVLGVNAGAIGFLTEVEPAQAAAALDQIIRGEYRIEERDKLSAWLDDEPLPDATNEVTVQTSRIAKLIRFRVSVSGEILDTLRGDGIIVSTPTGSTGYAMSVGGPLVHPLVRGTVLAPIAPFRLSARPWVVPADAVIEIMLEERDSAREEQDEKLARVVVDGQHGFGLASGSTVRIAPSPRKARFIRLGSGFYERVRTKLTR